MAVEKQLTPRDALRRFAACDLEGWPGLPASTTLRDVAAVFEVGDDEPVGGLLGSDDREAGWIAVAAAGYPDGGIRVWLDDDEVVLLDGADPELPDGVQPLLDDFEAPEAQLASYLGTFRLDGSEWVYPQRGITLYVNPETMAPLRVAAFVPTTLDVYERELRLDLEMRRLSLRRDR
jgi:hypothetical protein